jgi:heat shock protein HtpX
VSAQQSLAPETEGSDPKAHALKLHGNVPTSLKVSDTILRFVFPKKRLMKRIFLFLVTNLAVLALLTLVIFIIEQVFGVHLARGGVGGLLVFAAICGFGGALISLALSKWTAKRMMGVRVITAPQSDLERWLIGTVKRLADQAGVGMPEVGIFDAAEMNAFATGARRNAALVAVSSGLLRSMSGSQIEAVLGHEITHVANGDMVTLALLQGVLNTFVIFLARIIGNFVDRALFKNERGESGIGFFLTTMVAQIVLGIFASMIVSWYSRRREFRADRGGANLAGTGSMIDALQALKRSQGEPMPPQMQAFGINTGGSAGFMRLFMSHPPLDERIAALQSTG